tara:strand:- start:13500 stop:14051 length:552 start_codon:yes stop_codon:yes gene_type:complete
MPNKIPDNIPKWQSMNIEPKRKFKFILRIGDIPAWVVKSAGRPQVTISDGAKHQFLAHEFKFPGRVTWNDIEVTLVDPINPDVAATVFRVIEESGYATPGDWNGNNELWRLSISKRRAASAALSDVTIQTIDSDGKKVEEWRLYNAWIKNINYDDVSYESEDLMTVTVGLAYDWAKLESFVTE